MADRMEPVYEWVWRRKGEPDKVTRSTRTAHAYRKFAEKFGGTVTRRAGAFRIYLDA